jgi:DpnII restriction endonuclease
MQPWTHETALAEIESRLEVMNELVEADAYSSQHTRWRIGTIKFLQEVFGEASIFYSNFVRISWIYSGTMITSYKESLIPGATQQKYDSVAYSDAIRKAHGVLLAAKDELQRKGIEHVYEGKNTGPEASLILQVINLVELKLRKVIRTQPKKEREVQDGFESLLIGADIPYSREKDSIEYSSKTYVPDFTVAKADLAIDVKLASLPPHEKEIIAQINDDILAYQTKYGNLVFIVYDCGQIRDADLFISSFEAQGSVVVRVVKH